jgi:hypothetical protein
VISKECELRDAVDELLALLLEISDGFEVVFRAHIAKHVADALLKSYISPRNVLLMFNDALRDSISQFLR